MSGSLNFILKCRKHVKRQPTRYDVRFDLSCPRSYSAALFEEPPRAAARPPPMSIESGLAGVLTGVWSSFALMRHSSSACATVLSPTIAKKTPRSQSRNSAVVWSKAAAARRKNRREEQESNRRGAGEEQETNRRGTGEEQEHTARAAHEGGAVVG